MSSGGGGGGASGGGGGAADLFAAIKAGDEAAAARVLDAEPMLLGARTESGESPLMLSAYYRQGRIAQMLLARGATVDLFEACAIGETNRVEEILGGPGRVDDFAPDGFTPLTLACYFGHEDLVRRLLALGAKVDLAATNAMAVAPLHAAVAGRHAAIAALLLAARANPNAASHGGWRPVAQAAAHGDLEILKDLLDHGADPNPRNEEGKSALALAEEKGQAEAAALLRARGAA